MSAAASAAWIVSLLKRSGEAFLELCKPKSDVFSRNVKNFYSNMLSAKDYTAQIWHRVQI
jgi:hypothetical protein